MNVLLQFLPRLALPGNMGDLKLAGRDVAEEALSYVAPVGEEDLWIPRALRTVGEFIDEPALAAEGWQR